MKRFIAVLISVVLIVMIWMVPVVHAEPISIGIGVAAVVAAVLSAAGVSLAITNQSGGSNNFSAFTGDYLSRAISDGVFGSKYQSVDGLTRAWLAMVNVQNNLMYVGGEIYDELISFRDYLIDELGLTSTAKEVYSNNFLQTINGSVELSSFAPDQLSISSLGDYYVFSGNDVGSRYSFFTLPDGSQVYTDIVEGTYADKVYVGDQVLIDETFKLTSAGYYKAIWSWIVVDSTVFLVACNSTSETPDTVSDLIGNGDIDAIYQCTAAGSAALLSGALKVQGSISAAYDNTQALAPARGDSVAIEIPELPEDDDDIPAPLPEAILDLLLSGDLAPTQSLIPNEEVPNNPIDPSNPDNPQLPGLVVTGLQDVFPFCIPFDIYHFLEVLDASREIPKWHVPLDLGDYGTYYIDIDLTAFDTVATILRTLELLGFCVGLAIFTRRLLMGGG